MQKGSLKTKDQPGNATIAYESSYQLNTRPNHEALRSLTEEQWAFWINNGYIVIPQAVPQENVDRLVDLLWEFEEKDPHDTESWYQAARREHRMKELNNSGMVEIYNHQYLWDNRQSKAIYDAFVDVWGTDKLWVTIDRANMNFPVRQGHDFKGFIHWDIDTSLTPKPVNVQGVLALSETDDDTGGFQCIPSLYRNFDEWVKTQPVDRNPFQPDTTGLEIVKVKMKPGDMLIFNSSLAHGIRPNHSDGPRLAQYISMSPAEETNAQLTDWRVNSWRNRVAPEGYAFPGDPRKLEEKNGTTAKLTSLGEKLLGLREW